MPLLSGLDERASGANRASALQLPVSGLPPPGKIGQEGGSGQVPWRGVEVPTPIEHQEGEPSGKPPVFQGEAPAGSQYGCSRKNLHTGVYLEAFSMGSRGGSAWAPRNQKLIFLILDRSVCLRTFNVCVAQGCASSSS
jgi:hypothetical protein